MQLLLTCHTFAQSLLYNKDKNHTCSNPLLKSETKSSQIKTNSVIQLYLFNTDKTNWNMCNQNVFHLTISTWQFIYKILYVCSTAFLLPFGTQMPIVVLLKLSYFLLIKALQVFWSSSLKILLKEGLCSSRIFLLDLLNRAKY